MDSETIKAIRNALSAIRDWPDPQPGAGAQIGPLFGAGMYAQYDSDRERHQREIDSILMMLAKAEGSTDGQ